MERPFYLLRDIFRKSNEENKELVRYVFEKSDSLTLWVLGLAIGGISIFANNLGDIQKAVDPKYLKLILTLLAISVTSGLIYRGLFLYFFVILNQTIRGIDISFSNREIMATESYLTGNESFVELIKALKDDFGEDQSNLIPLYNQSNDQVRQKLYSDMVSLYHNLVLFVQKDLEIANDFIADTYSKFFDKKKEHYLKQLQSPNASGQFRLISWLTAIFYFIYIGTFVISLFLFVAGI